MHHLIMIQINPAIVVLIETRLTRKIDDNEVSVPGYSMVRCDSDSKNIGNVTVCVKNDIRYETILTRKIESNTVIEVKEKWYKL